MEEMSKHGEIGHAAMKAGMDRKTARKYASAGKLPSEMVTPRDWRTREDPFAEDWAEVEALLRERPELEAKTLFEVLCEKYPGRYEAGQLRTLQRHVREWRASDGPDKEMVLAQQHRPGEAAQTDFTRTTELAVTIAGQLFVHLLCVFVLPFSNWQWATVCLSESMAALRKGVQRALFQLGRVPRYHQTDNSTAATHRIPDGKKVVLEDGKRPFNEDYLALMRHFGMTPRTTEVGAKEQNGDVEAANGALKRRLEQALLLRGSRDFESVEAWQAFVDEVARKANRAGGARRRGPRAMRELNVAKLPEFIEEIVRVSEWSTIRVKHCAYSVPSRLIGEVLACGSTRTGSRRTAAEAPARVRAAARSQPAPHRLPARHLVARAQAGRVRALRLPRGDVPLAGVPPRVRRDPDAAPRTQGRPRVPAHPAPRAEHAGGRRRGRARAAARRGAGDHRRRGEGAGLAGSRPALPELAAPAVDLPHYDALLAEVAA